MPVRQQNFQNVAWFKDLATRELLDLNPRYQRRSVWTDSYREDFIDTILLDYPAPAIFLYEKIDASESGSAHYAVVDGKQRLTTILDFIANRFPVGEKCPLTDLVGKYYEGLPRDIKVAFLRYRFSVEYLPSEDEDIINNIFDRLNRNVKKLTAQELRHAKYDGQFINAAEQLAEWVQIVIKDFPRLADSSRRQMKDVEIVATLLLYLDEGVKSYSTATLDEAFAQRETDWPRQASVTEEFRAIIEYIVRLTRTPDSGPFVQQSRLRNQADFYSLFGAISELRRAGALPEPDAAAAKLVSFLSELDATSPPSKYLDYYEAARSASNDAGPRRRRMEILKTVLLGQAWESENDSTGG